MVYSQLPPLNSIKAFDAVVRYGSISEAARVLCVSQSAVSRHILKLEEFMDSQLLVRGKLGTTVTAEGEALYEQTSQSLNALLEVSSKLRASQSGITVIKVNSFSSFALKWFVPRLNDFRAAHPDIVLDITIADERPDFQQSQKDCAIVAERDHSSSKNDDVLFSEELVLVAAPSLLETQSFASVEDIFQFPLIHTSTRSEVWDTLCQYFDIENRERLSGLSFQDFYISIAACIAGSGVALVPSFLVDQELADGVLVQLLDEIVPTGKSYRLVISSLKWKDDAVLALQQWLLDETEALRA